MFPRCFGAFSGGIAPAVEAEVDALAPEQGGGQGARILHIAATHVKTRPEPRLRWLRVASEHTHGVAGRLQLAGDGCSDQTGAADDEDGCHLRSP